MASQMVVSEAMLERGILWHWLYVSNRSDIVDIRCVLTGKFLWHKLSGRFYILRSPQRGWLMSHISLETSNRKVQIWFVAKTNVPKIPLFSHFFFISNNLLYIQKQLEFPAWPTGYVSYINVWYWIQYFLGEDIGRWASFLKADVQNRTLFFSYQKCWFAFSSIFTLKIVYDGISYVFLKVKMLWMW